MNDRCSFDILRFPCFVRLFQILEQCVLKESTIAIDFWLTLHRKWWLLVWVKYSRRGQLAADNQSINQSIIKTRNLTSTSVLWFVSGFCLRFTYPPIINVLIFLIATLDEQAYPHFLFTITYTSCVIWYFLNDSMSSSFTTIQYLSKFAN